MNKFYLNSILVAVSIFIGYKATDVHWSNKFAEAELLATQNQLLAVSRVINTHNQRVTELEKVNRETEKKLNDATLNNNRLDATNDSLQQQFSKALQRSATCDESGSVPELAAEATDRTVQAYVFGIVASRATTYAKIADDNRTRGLSCQNEFAIVTGQTAENKDN